MALTQVKTAGIAADAVTGAKVADDQIDSEHYVAASIDHEHLANNSIDGDNIVADTIDSQHYAAGSVDHEHLAGDCVDGDNIADDSIGAEHIADNAVGLAAMASGTDGQIITYDASGNPVAVGPGTDGQVLTSTGAGSPPAFEAIPASGTPTNLINNGAMKVAQRATSSTTSGMESVDRWNCQWSGHDENCTQAQVGVTADTDPWNLGFRYALKITNGNQTSGAGAADYMRIYQTMEAQDLAASGWDYTSASSYVTLSFWVKASVAQTYYGYLLSADGTAQRYAFSLGSLSADTWTKVTKTIPGTANITINNDVGIGMYLFIQPFAGTDTTDSGVSLVGWEAHNTSARMPDHTSTWWTTNDATFELTGVQLEVGSSAGTFQHRSFGEELAICQRYYYKKSMFYSACMTYTPGSGDHSFTRMNTDHPVEMRTNPSGIAGDFAVWSWSSASGTSTTTWSFDNSPLNSMLTMNTAHTNLPAPANGPGSGHMVPCRALNIEFDAEL